MVQAADRRQLGATSTPPSLPAPSWRRDLSEAPISDIGSDIGIEFARMFAPVRAWCAEVIAPMRRPSLSQAIGLTAWTGLLLWLA